MLWQKSLRVLESTCTIMLLAYAHKPERLQLIPVIATPCLLPRKIACRRSCCLYGAQFVTGLANGDLKGINTKQTFCLIFSYFRVHHKGTWVCSLPFSFSHREFKSALGQGHFKVARCGGFLCHSLFLPLTLFLPLNAAAHRSSAACPCAEGRLLIMLTTRAPGWVNHQH